MSNEDYERGYADGESNLLADVEFFLNEVLGIEFEEGETWQDALRRTHPGAASATLDPS